MFKRGVMKGVDVTKKWVKEEDGFQVFEKFGLTQGGVILALGVAAVSIMIMNTVWNDVGEAYFGGEDTTAGAFGSMAPTTMPQWTIN